MTLARSPLFVGLLAAFLALVGGVLLAFGGPLAAAAVLIAGTGALIILRDIEVGFYAVIGVVCLLPFATIPVDIGLTPTFLDVALGATVGIWLLEIVTGRKRTVITAPVTVPLILFMIVAVFAFIFGLNNGPLTPNLLRHFAELLLSLGFVIVVIDYCREWSRLERLVKALLLAGAGAALIGIFFWVLPDENANTLLNYLQRVGYPGGMVLRYIEDNPELSERAIGTSVDPNSFGGLLLMIGALAGPQVVAKYRLFNRPVTFAIVGLIFLCLVLTFSRGAMLGLAAGWGLVAVARYRRLLPYMVIIGLLFLLLPVTQGYVQRFVEGIQGNDLATQMRFGEYKDALILIGRYPLFGVGFAGSPDIDIYLGVASLYLLMAQQMGVLGLLVFAVLVCVVFGYAFFNRGLFRRHLRLDPVWLGLHAALAGGLVAGVLDHYLFNIDFHHAVTVFWLFIALAVASTRLGILQDAQESRPKQSHSTVPELAPALTSD